MSVAEDISRTRDGSGSRQEGSGPACPICGSRATVLLCEVDGYDIWRCPLSAVDFVHPAPTPAALKALYDRPDWFEAGERGGYSSYDAQTDPSPAWLVTLLDRLTAERRDPSILDIGCAYGTHLALARDKGWQAFGVEPSRHARAEARTRHLGLYVAETVEEIPPHRFDLILLLDVIEHLSDPYALFHELAAKDAIGPETILVVTTPNARSHDALREPAGWAYRHPPSHLTFYSATAFEELFRRLRFSRIEIRGQHPLESPPAELPADEGSSLNASLMPYAGLLCEASGSGFAAFMQERYVPGTWSEIAAYEHMPRYGFALGFAGEKRVLDFGCGSGYGSAILAQTARSVVGLDISQDALAYARDHHARGNLSFLHDAELGASLPDASFDLIVCFEVIEHVDAETQRRLVSAFRRLLATDGRLLISTPNPEVTALYGENPYHLRELTRPEFEALLHDSFPHVRLVEQSIHACVLLQPVDVEGAIELRYDVPEFAGESRPAIYIAVCGDAPIGTLAGRVYPDLARDYIQLRTEAIRWRNQQLIDRTNLVQLRAALASERELAANRAAQQEAALGSSLEQLAGALERLGALQTEHAGTATDLAREKASSAALGQQIGTIRSEKETVEADLQAVRVDLEQTTVRLTAIETSRSWRFMQGSALFLKRLRSPMHPVVRSIRRAGRRLRRVEKPRDPCPPRSAAGPVQRDLMLERCLDPVWNDEKGAFELRRDEAMLAEHKAVAAVSDVAGPYVVRPLTPIDPAARRPRILHVIPNVYVGGSTQLIIDIVQHLSGRFEHEIVTSALWPGGNHDGLTVHHVPQPSAAAMADLYIRLKPALIHVHYWGLTDDPWYHAAIDAMAGIPARALMNINTPIEPLLNPRFEHYVFVSEYVRSQFGGGITDRSRISVIHPGIDLSLFSDPYSDPDAENAIGMVYRLEDDKLRSDAIDLFIEVVRRRPRTKVYIIGGGSFFLPYVERTIAAGVRQNFRFTGYVAYEDLPKWYDRFALFVAPVWKESFGQVTPFAMSKGSAVAGYAVGALSEIIGSTETLGSTLEETAGIIVDLLNDRQRLREHGRRNEERVRALFDVRSMVAQYGAIYDSLLAGAAESGPDLPQAATEPGGGEQVRLWTAEVGRLQRQVEAKDIELVQLGGKLAETLGLAEQDKLLLTAVKRSRSWRLTRPLRRIGLFGHHEKQLFRHRRGRGGQLELRLRENPQLLRPDGEFVLVVSHDATRTGAPILAWNICRELQERFNVVVLLLGGGNLSGDFDGLCSAVVGPYDSAVDRHVLAMSPIVEALCARYPFKFAIVNSIESRAVLQSLATNFVPSVLLIHEFFRFYNMGFFSPLNGASRELTEALAWAGGVVFSARMVRDSTSTERTQLAAAAARVIPQGKTINPSQPKAILRSGHHADTLRRSLFGEGPDKPFVVLGAGTVDYRKGVDLFVATVAEIKRLEPEIAILAVWVGAVNDAQYANFVAAQIEQSGLQECVRLVGERTDLEDIYTLADICFISSRLDPLPNVAIEAMAAGLPVLCFDKACGLAESLAEDPGTAACVVPFLDIDAAAHRIIALCRDPEMRTAVSEQMQSMARQRFNMKRYIGKLLDLSAEVAAAARQEAADVAILEKGSDFVADFYLPFRSALTREAAIREFVKLCQSRIYIRKPAPGFLPHLYADRHDLTAKQINPFVHFVQSGKPAGPWQEDVIDVAREHARPVSPQRVFVHVHARRPKMLKDVVRRLALNNLQCDLLVSCVLEEDAHEARDALRAFGACDIRIVADRGGGLDPLLAEFAGALSPYDVVGHFHTCEHAVDPDVARDQAEYRLETLIGGKRPSADAIIAAFAEDPFLGLVFADDPEVLGWDGNRPLAERLARQIGIGDLPDLFFPFPAGLMFWCRRAALKPLLDLWLDRGNGLDGPMTDGGSMPRAIERLLPSIVHHAGFVHRVAYAPRVQGGMG